GRRPGRSHRRTLHRHRDLSQQEDTARRRVRRDAPVIEGLLPLLLVLPMAGFLITAFIGRRFGKRAHWIPVGAIFLAWIVAMIAVVSVLTGAAPLLPGSENTHGYIVGPWVWIPAGGFHADLGLFVDPLTACLLIVVTTIGLLVHVYSIGYMSHDPGY